MANEPNQQQQFQTVTIPGHGDVDFPAEMSDDAIAMAIKGLPKPAETRLLPGTQPGGFSRGGTTATIEGAGRAWDWLSTGPKAVDKWAAQNLPANLPVEGRPTGVGEAAIPGTVTHPQENVKQASDMFLSPLGLATMGATVGERVLGNMARGTLVEAMMHTSEATRLANEGRAAEAVASAHRAVETASKADALMTGMRGARGVSSGIAGAYGAEGVRRTATAKTPEEAAGGIVQATFGVLGMSGLLTPEIEDQRAALRDAQNEFINRQPPAAPRPQLPPTHVEPEAPPSTAPHPERGPEAPEAPVRALAAGKPDIPQLTAEAGGIYKGETVPGSGQHMVEHPAEPGVVTKINESEVKGVDDIHRSLKPGQEIPRQLGSSIQSPRPRRPIPAPLVPENEPAAPTPAAVTPEAIVKAAPVVAAAPRPQAVTDEHLWATFNEGQKATAFYNDSPSGPQKDAWGSRLDTARANFKGQLSQYIGQFKANPDAAESAAVRWEGQASEATDRAKMARGYADNLVANLQAELPVRDALKEGGKVSNRGITRFRRGLQAEGTGSEGEPVKTNIPIESAPAAFREAAHEALGDRLKTVPDELYKEPTGREHAETLARRANAVKDIADLKEQIKDLIATQRDPAAIHLDEDEYNNQLNDLMNRAKTLQGIAGRQPTKQVYVGKAVTKGAPVLTQAVANDLFGKKLKRIPTPDELRGFAKVQDARATMATSVAKAIRKYKGQMGVVRFGEATPPDTQIETIIAKAREMNLGVHTLAERPAEEAGWLLWDHNTFVPVAQYNHNQTIYPLLTNGRDYLEDIEAGGVSSQKAQKVIDKFWAQEPIRKEGHHLYQIQTRDSLGAVDKMLQAAYASGDLDARKEPDIYIDLNQPGSGPFDNHSPMGLDLSTQEYLDSGDLQKMVAAAFRRRRAMGGFINLNVILGPVVHEIANFAKEAWGGVAEMGELMRSLLMPKAGAPVEVLDAIYKYKGNIEEERWRIAAVMNKFRDETDKLNRADQIQLIDMLKRDPAQITNPVLSQLAATIRSIDDRLYNEMNNSLRLSRGQNAAATTYLENHFRLIYKTLPGGTAGGFRNWLGKRPIQGSRGMLRQHTYDDLSAAMAAGGVPITTNPIEMFETAALDALRLIHGAKLIKWAKDSGNITFAPMGNRSSVPQFWRRIDDPSMRIYFPASSGEGLVHAGDYYAEPHFYGLMKNYLSPDYIKRLAVGRMAMDLKNVLGQWELFGLFHPVTMSVLATSSDFGLGLRGLENMVVKGDPMEGLEGIARLLKAPAASITASREGRSMKMFAEDAARFLATPRGQSFIQAYPNADQLLHYAFIGGLKLDAEEDLMGHFGKRWTQAIAEKQFIKATFLSGPSLAETAMAPIFRRWIPALKLGVFLRDMSKALQENADLLTSGRLTPGQLSRRVVNGVEMAFGENNFDNFFFPRTFKTAMQLLYRSFTWRLGNVLLPPIAVGGQVREFAQGRAPRVDPNTSRILGLLMATIAAGYLVQKLSTGKSPSSYLDFTHPKIGGLDDRGKPVRVDLPSYFSRDWSSMQHSPGNYFSGGTSALVTRIFDQWRNRDFYGRQIADPTQPTYDQFLSRMRYMVPDNFMMSNWQKIGQTGKREAGLSLLGMTPASRSLDLTPAEAKLQEFERRHYSNTGQPIEDVQRREALRDLTRLARNNDARYGAVSEEYLSKQYISEADLDKLESSSGPLSETWFERLASNSQFTIPELLSAYSVAKGDEKAVLEDVLDKRFDSKAFKSLPFARQEKLDEAYRNAQKAAH